MFVCLRGAEGCEYFHACKGIIFSLRPHFPDHLRKYEISTP